MNAKKNGVLDNPKDLRAFLNDMRDNVLSHDVVFVVNGHRFPVHPYLVMTASPVLRCILTNGMKETSQRDIALKEVNVDAWKAVLDYIYTGQMTFANVEKARQYLYCADWLQMERLTCAISEFIE